MSSARTAVVVAGLLALASALAVGYAPVATAGKEGSPRHPSLRNDETMRAEAVENLERQAAKLALRDGSSCPHDFSSLDTGRALRVSLFYGYDEHEGRVHDRVHARAMLEILTKECRGRLSACDFSVVSRSASAASLARTIGGRRVEVDLFTTSLPEGVDESTSYVSALFEQDRLSRSVKERFFRELVESDVVFYMGHSRLGGGMGFDDQTGATTLVNAFFRRPLVPVLEALRQRPTNLKILGLFSCESERYFRRGFQAANPALSLILTTGDIRYGPAEQTSLGALEAILSRYCGYAFHDSMISANEPDRNMTWLIRGR